MEKSFTMKSCSDTIYSSTNTSEKLGSSKNALWKSISISLMFIMGLTMNAQVTVTGDAAGTYADLGAAITALNNITGTTLTQNTVVTVAAGNAQTAPAGGYIVNVTGTSTASLTFVGNGNTISTPVQTAAGILDAAIKFIGSDFVTFSGFTINASAGTVKATATNDRTEWGIAFMAASATDGCSNNTITNCTIQMGTGYANSRGIYFGCTHLPTAAATAQLATATSGTNSNNTIYNNTIDSAQIGIYFLTTPNTASIIESGNKFIKNTITLACHDHGTATATGHSAYNLGLTTSRIVGIEYRNGVSGYVVDSNTISIAPPVFTNTTTTNLGYAIAGFSATPSTVAAGFVGAPNYYRYNTINLSSTNNSTGSAKGIEAVITPTTPLISNIAKFNNITLSYTSTGLTSTSQSHTMFGIDMGVGGQKTCRADSNTLLLIRTLNGAGSISSQQSGIAVGGFGSSPTTTVFDTTSAIGNTITMRQFHNSTITPFTTGATSFFIDVKSGNGYAIVTDNILTTGNDSLFTPGQSVGVNKNFVTYTKGVDFSRNTITVNNTLHPTVTSATAFTGISTSGSSLLDSFFRVNNNTIRVFARKGVSGISATDGTTTTVADKFTNNNYINIVMDRVNATLTCSGTGISVSSGKRYFCENNTIDRMLALSSVPVTTGGFPSLTGISMTSGSITGVSTGLVRNNVIDSIIVPYAATTATATITGVSLSTSTGLMYSLHNNQVSNLFAGATTTGSSSVRGLSVTSSTVIRSIRNNLFTNLTNNSLGTTAVTQGINNTSSSGSDTFVNNIVSNVVCAQRSPNNFGYQMSSSTNAFLWNNTFHITGLTTDGGGTSFAATGVQYTTSGSLDLRNNIIHLDNAASSPGPAGTGTYAALRLATNVTPAVAPTNLTAVNNIYYTPAVPNSYLYAEGVLTSAITDTFSLSGDPAFNQSCGIYKTFMGAKDQGSVTESVPVTITNGIVTPTATPNLADNNAQVLSAVTTDYNNTARGTFPDIGAVEFTTSAPIDQAGPVINYSLLPNLACFNQQVLSATITDNSGVNTTTAKPRLYYRKTTDATTFGANTSAGTGWKYVEASNTTSPFTFTMDYSLLTSVPAVGDSIQYFVVAQDNVGTPNVSGKTVSLTPSNTCLTSVNLASVAGLTDAVGGNTFVFLSQPTITFDVKKNPICSGLTDTVKGTLTQAGNILLGNTTTTGTGTGQSIFAGGWGGTKSQYIIRASELTAQGLSGGPITAIGFTPTTSATTYEGVQLWIGHTALAAFPNTTFIDTLAQTKVYEAPGALASFTPTANTVNTFTFGTIGTPAMGSPVSSSFVWDGVSNIVLTFCHSENPTAATVAASSMQFHVPGFACAIVRQNDNQSMSAMLGQTTGTNNTNRPNFVISGNKAPVVSSAINPASGYVWNTGATTQTFFPNPSTVPITTYKLTITDVSGCQVNDSTNITVDPLPALPTITNISKCGLAPSTATAVADATTPAITGPIFKWYKTPTSTTVLQSSTDAFYNGNSPAFGTDTFYVSVTNPITTCEGPRAMMVYTSTAPPDTIAPTINMMADSAKICEGASVLLNVTQGPGTSFTSFTWFSDSTQAGANPSLTGASQTVTPTSPGTYIYKVTATGGGCSVNKTVKIIIDKDYFAIAPTSIKSDTNLACIGTLLNHQYGQGGAAAGLTYPVSGATSTADEEILRVTFGVIDNVTACPQPGIVGTQGTGVQVGTNGQIDFTNSTVPVPLLVPGQSTNLTVQVGTCGGNFNNMTKAFFDWNQDGDFVDAGEEFLLTPAAVNGPNTTTPFAITTPLSASFGKTRMRVVTVETSAATGVTSNATYSWGETEDYTVQVGIPNLTYQWTSNKTGATILSDSSKLPQVLNDTLITYQLVTKSGACSDTATNTITGITLPLAPTAVTINKCGIGVNTSNAVTDVSVPVISQPIFNWYAAATGGSPLQSDTFRYWNNTTNIGTDSFFVSVANPLGGCEGPRTKVTYVTTPATDTILPKVNGIATDSFAICEGASINLTVTQGPGTTYTTFNWFSDSLASGANPALTGATQTVTPATPGTYIYTINAAGGACNASKSIKVVVSKDYFAVAPTAFTSAPNPACVGTVITNTYAQGGAGTPPTYCASAAGSTSDEEISKVEYLSINNASACASLTGTQGTATGTADLYSDWTASAVPVPLLVPNTTDSLKVTIQWCGGFVFGSAAKAWIDWNIDGDFVDPGEEFVVMPASTGANSAGTTFSVPITVPANATFGNTRLRVSVRETTLAGITPCQNGNWGETEDYTVKVGIPGITYQWTSSKTGSTILSDSSKMIVALADTSVDYVLVTKAGACSDTAVNNVIGFPLPAAPLAVAKTKCGVGADTSAVVTDATSPLIAGPIFKWYKTATSTTVLQNDILRFWNGNTVLGNDTFYVSTFNQTTGCEGPRSMMVYTTTTPPDTIAPKVNGFADSTAICEGANLVLSVTQGPGTSFTSFTWFSDSLNSGANPAITGATNTVVPGSVGTYTYKVTASGGGCIVSKEVKVRVDKNYFAIAPTSFTSNPNPACVGTQITNTYAQGGSGTPPTYCASAAGNTSDEEISKVQYLSINNTSGCASLTGTQGTATGTADLYSDWTASAVPVPLLVPNTTDSLKVTIQWCGNFVFGSAAKAWIDWNIDGDFADPGEEFVVMPASTGANAAGTTFTVPITVPSTATFGNTRMRVSVRETTLAGITPCQNGNWGETEDYTVKVGIPGITYQWTSSKTGSTILSDSSKMIVALADTSVDYVLVTKAGACTDTAVNTVTDNVPALVSNPIVGPVDATSCDTVTLKGTSTGGCGPYTYAWSSANANFVSATNDSVVRFLLTGTSGAKNVKLVITDNLGAKDSFTQTITLTTPQLLTTTPDTICGTQTASLAATVNTGSDIKWYNSASINDTILAVGSPFVTPLLSSADTFFVEATADGALQYVARPTAPVASFASGSNNIGLKFTTTKQIVLDSVDLFAGTATSTSMTIGLFVEGSATPIKSATVTTTGGTKVLSGVELGWTITPGTYRILRTAASSSYHRETGIATSPYPMKLGSSGSIDSGVSSVTGAGSVAEYNLFYNWRIKEVCTTPRTAVIVNSVSAPALTLNKSMDSMCSGLVSDTVKLTSTVSDYNTYTWSPATGVAGAANAWVVNETIPGTYKYIITGTQTAGLGCVNKDTLDFIVKAVPAVFTIAPAGPLTLCNGTAQQLVAPSGTSSMTWSSTTGLFSNSSATTSYTGTDRDTVWAAPADTIKYFATATHPNGCTRMDSITINVVDTVSITTQPVASTLLCQGSPLNLNVVASSTSPITYQWRKGGSNITNTTSSVAIASSAVTDSGAYDVIVSTGTPCASKTSTVATVKVSPSITITTQPLLANVCQGQPFSLIAAATGDSSITWTQLTGSNTSNTDTLSKTSASLSDSGMYFVTYKAFAPCSNKNSDTVKVTVFPASFVSTDPVNTTVCQGTTATFTATGKNSVSVSWRKGTSALTAGGNIAINNVVAGDSTVSTLTITNASFSDTGSYRFVSVTGGSGCANDTSSSATLSINAKPTITSTTLPATTVCAGTTMSFAVTASNNSRVVWYGGASGTDSIQNATSFTLPATAGIYKVKVIGNSPCGDTTSATVTTTVTPLATITKPVILSNPICAGSTTTVSANFTNADSVVWFQGATRLGLGSVAGSTSTFTVSSAGTYTARAYSANGCINVDSTSNTLSINAKPTITTSTLPATTVCAGTTMSFAVTASNNSRVVWYGGASGTDSIQNATSFTLPATAGIYKVKVIGNSPCGDTTSATVTTTVTPLATITKPVILSNPICAGSTTTVSANFTNADSVVWFQGATRLGLGSVAGSTSTFTVSSAGTYTARAYSANGCINVDSTSNTLSINAKPTITSTTLPATTVCAGTTMSFAVTASNNSRVVWYGGASGTDSIQNATSFTLPATAGIYKVKVIGNSPCGDTTSATVTTTVTPLASITTQPSATTVCQGSAMSFTISASNADSVVWFRGTTRVGTGTTYSVSSATSADSANYSAIAYSASGCTNATSNVVLGAVKPQATITTQPVANTYVLTGGTASISVSASNFDSVVWYKGSTRVSNGTTLSITNFDSATHAGAYTARVYSNAPCTNYVSSSTANIIKSTCPVITMQPMGDTLCIGSTYTLSVTAGAVNTYEWYKVGNTTPIATTSSTSLNLSTLTSGGSYYVKLTPLTGCTTTVTSDTVKVGVDDSTRITAQPTASTTICEGSALNLSVTATGSGTISYQWMNGSTNVGTNSNSFSVSSAATSNAGTYKVVVSSTSSCPSATSNNATVAVTPAAVITTQPSSSTICEGSTLSFTIAATNADSIVWFRGSTRVGTGSTFSQTNAQTTNSGNYVAIAYRGAGCTNVSSNSVSGTVNAAPVITAQPASSAFGCNGSNFNSLSVVASNATSYQWKQGSTNKGGTSATISINPFTVSDTGNYTVVVSGTAPCADVTSTIANIKITDTAKIVTQPASLTDVCNGGTLKLSVVGNGAASYQWYKGSTAIAGETKDSLVIASVSSATAGTYKVEAIAFAGCVNTMSTNAVVTVSNPVTFTTQPAAQTICAGGTISLSTAVSGNSSPTYVWKKDGVALGAASSSSYSKSSALVSDSGSYTVDVTGASSCPTITSNVAKVTINAAPTISAISGTSPLCVGSTMTLSATATNNNGVIWKQGTTTVGTSSTYSKTAATSDAGSYTVTAIAKAGCTDVTSTVYTQAITSPVTITSQPVSTAVLTGTSFTLSVTASNANTYQWYKGTTAISGATSSSYTVSSFDSATDAGAYTVQITSNSPCTNTVTSNTANVTKTTCPVITSNPVGDTLCSGSSLTLSVTAVGANGFKWYKDGVFITGATNSIYTVSSATAANSGTYKVEAMPFTGASCGQIISPDVKVLVESTPVISAQPQGNTLCNPTSHTLTVTTSTTGHSYQWFKNGTAIAGANNASLNVSGLTSAGDKYFVQISGTGACPTVSSDTALLITRNPQNLVKLVTNSEQNLVEQCTDNNWTYYAKAGVPNEFLLAIRKNGNNVMFAPDIEINPAGIITLQHSANNPNGAILGRRFFNIDVISGALQYPYDVKFYYAPADTLEVMNKLAQLKAANANVTASRPSSSWITSTLVPFTSSLLSSVTSAPLSFANTIVSSNSNGKDNNVDYVEITNLVAKNGGGTMFMDYTITSGSGIADRINKGFGIEMFPVPATTDLNVRLTSNTFKPVSFTITDMNGKVVMSSEERHQTNTTEHKFDISNLANGVYHIQLTNGETQSAAKFTVSK